MYIPMKVGSVEGKMELPQNGFLTESRCMREITKTENGTEQSPVVVYTGKKCMSCILRGCKNGKEAKWMSDGTQFNSDMSFEKTADDSTEI